MRLEIHGQTWEALRPKAFSWCNELSLHLGELCSCILKLLLGSEFLTLAPGFFYLGCLEDNSCLFKWQCNRQWLPNFGSNKRQWILKTIAPLSCRSDDSDPVSPSLHSIPRDREHRSIKYGSEHTNTNVQVQKVIIEQLKLWCGSGTCDDHQSSSLAVCLRKSRLAHWKSTINEAQGSI
jgi:hypothetical protein